jgi:hypothetical protein
MQSVQSQTKTMETLQQTLELHWISPLGDPSLM